MDTQDAGLKPDSGREREPMRDPLEVLGPVAPAVGLLKDAEGAPEPAGSGNGRQDSVSGIVVDTHWNIGRHAGHVNSVSGIVADTSATQSKRSRLSQLTFLFLLELYD